jgi:hypothetical protein
MSEIAYLKVSSLLASATGLWMASLSPSLALPIQGVCLGGALVACGVAVSQARQGIRPESMARVREGFNFEAVKQEMAIAAASLEQATKARYFPNEVEHPMAQRELLERSYAASPGALQVGPELVQAVRALVEAGLKPEAIAAACLGGAANVAGVDEVLKIGEEQGW